MRLPTPPLPELVRADATSVDAAVSWFRGYYETPPVPWNYTHGTKCVKQAYKGLQSIKLLTAGCENIKNKVGQISNKQVVTLAAPLAFGRSIQVFDLPRRQFRFGRDRRCGFRVPFFFVEDGLIRLYFLQPRKCVALTMDELGMLATIHKRYLIDTEFYGEPVDIEYVDVSLNPESNRREVRKYCLEDLQLWSEAALRSRLTTLAEALHILETDKALSAKRRIAPRPDPELPLFD